MGFRALAGRKRPDGARQRATFLLHAVFDRARRDLVVDVLNDLNDQNLFILAAASQAPEPFVKAVYDRYRHVALRQNEEPFSYVHFYSNLSYLQSIGLILLLSTKVSRTYTNRIQLLFSPELLETIGKARFS